MADPQTYSITYNFSGYQANNPQTPLPALPIDNEFANISFAIDAIVAAIKDVRRSDGALKNKIVTLDSLADELRSAGLYPIAGWETGQVYKAGRILAKDAGIYQVAEDHTSGTFSTDLADGKLTLLAVLPDGPKGDAATIAVGAVTTGAPGSSVIVTNVGDEYDAVLDFTIPEGDKGDQGDPGPAAWATPVAWSTAQNFTATAPRSAVTQAGETYVCLVPHTSGVFATDLAAGKWIKVAAKGADGLGVGDTVGPAGATAGHIATFADTTGKLLADGGVAVSADGTFASNSDAKLPTEKAVKTYADGLISALRNGVAAAYDTLAEIAAWIGTTGTAALKNIGTSGNVVPLLDGANTWSAKQIFAAILKFIGLLEKVTITAGAPASTQHFDWATQAIEYFTSNCANNWTLNVRGNSGATLDSLMAVGEAISLAIIVTNGGTAYRMTALTIDGNAITPQWLGAAAPSAGTINKRDTYTVFITKTGSATFIAHASFASGN